MPIRIYSGRNITYTIIIDACSKKQSLDHLSPKLIEPEIKTSITSYPVFKADLVLHPRNVGKLLGMIIMSFLCCLRCAVFNRLTNDGTRILYSCTWYIHFIYIYIYTPVYMGGR